MTPDRRTFLRLLAAGAISPLVDVDRLLWVPGAKTWFLPPAAKATTIVSGGIILQPGDIIQFSYDYPGDTVIRVVTSDRNTHDLIAVWDGRNAVWHGPVRVRLTP